MNNAEVFTGIHQLGQEGSIPGLWKKIIYQSND